MRCSRRRRNVQVMTYVIGSACVDVMDRSCVQECPVDCIYEGSRSLISTHRNAWIAVHAS